MNAKLTFIITIAVLFFSSNIYSQSTKSDFVPNGKPIVKVFANYHTDFGEITTARIRRAYLGYKYNLSENYKLNLTLDVLNLTGFYQAYLKNAYLKYSKDKLSYSIGIIPTKQFKVQEKIWGYRYIQKVFSDKYALNASADLGASAQYKFNKMISADIIVQNGTGYKKIKATKTYRGGAGITIKPLSGLTLRTYYDLSQKPEVSKQDFVGFVSYKFKNKFLLAGEYNYQTGFGFVKDKDYGGYSFFARYFLNKKIELFARYDKVNASVLENETEEWFSGIGDYLLGGVQYNPVKGVKFSLNYQGYHLPLSEKDKYVSLMYFNLEFKIP